MDTLFFLGIIFVLGALTEWLSPKMHIPRVVGYLILGLIIGPETIGLIPREFVDNSHIITDLALSIIAVLIGSTLEIATLNGHAKEIAYITIAQSLGTFLIVITGFILMGEVLHVSAGEIIITAFLLAGIAVATAPATPLAIAKELNAKGNFTSTLLAIVAADDAISLIIFTLALTVGVALMDGGVFEWINIGHAIMIIVLSTVIGVIAAVINTILDKLFSHHKGMETIATLGLIFIVYSINEYWHLEPLLSAMVMGTVMVNTSPDFDIVHEEIDNHLAEIIFMLFFIISSMHLKFNTLFILPVAIELYVVLRLFGKVLGSYLGAVISGSSDMVKKYMGFALIPQAGVAIGLALSIQKHDGLENIAPIILNIVIATTLIHELVGPFLTKYAIEKSGESFKKKD